jgi:hypothetical protein
MTGGTFLAGLIGCSVLASGAASAQMLHTQQGETVTLGTVNASVYY